MPQDSNRWCRRMFASVDVAGSTQFKQRHPEDSGRWANVFRLFFDEFPTTLRSCFEQVSGVPNGKPAAPMSVWKFVGDEILFATEIKRHEEAAFHALAFKLAINEYSLQLKRKKDLADLSLKGTLWGAGFPVSNVEVAPPIGNGGAPQDFLGPCVDQGFRLCSLADYRRIPVSVDIAYMLATTAFSGHSPLKLQCEEPKLHKGVPYAYPHIWIDRSDGSKSAEDKILGRREVVDPSDLKPYLEELYEQGRAGLFRPFLVEDPSELYNVVPERMSRTRERMLQFAAEESYSSSETARTGSPSESPPSPKLPS